MDRKKLFLTLAILLIFIGSIIAVSLVIITTDGSGSEVDKPFWKTGIIYQIYPRSLRDTDDNGIGDLAGITSKLPELKELGIGSIWLSPIFTSPMADFGYDISNYTEIDPIFGTMEDFDILVLESHAKGLKVIVDFVPNHSSDEHKWFQMSLRKEDPYTDFYIWAEPKSFDNITGVPYPPNNWLNAFGGSAWTWREERNQFYFHQYLDKQPDLDYRNLKVRQEMEDVIRFWMDRGADGIRIDAIRKLFEVEDISQDEPASGNPNVEDPNEYGYLNHTLTTDQPEIFEVLKEWRLVLDSYSDTKVMIPQVSYDVVETAMPYYGTVEDPLADFPFNFNIRDDFKNRSDVSGFNIKASIDDWLDKIPEGKWPNWLLGSHDNSRIGTRVNSDLVDAFNMISLLLPGTAITYYGEEIGMVDTDISYAETQDPSGCYWGPDRYMEFSRDPARTPMQWDNSSFAGFTVGNSTWLPVHENYKSLNVFHQNASAQSTYKIYKKLAELRKEEVFFSGKLAYPVITEHIFSFTRYLSDVTYLIVINTSKSSVHVDLLHEANFQLPNTAEVVLRSSFDWRNTTEPGSMANLSNVSLLGGEGMIFIYGS